jgi:hypothetical protein
VKGIPDTGFLVAFANRGDRHHGWAVRVAEGVTEPLLTCEPVLAEAAFHLQRLPLVLAMLREGLVTLAFAAANTFRSSRHWRGGTPTGSLTWPTCVSSE